MIPIHSSQPDVRVVAAGGLGFDMVRSRSVMPQTVREKFGRQAPAWPASFRQPARRAAGRMSTEPSRNRGFGPRLLGSSVRLAYLAAVVIFLRCVAQFYH